MATGYIFTTTDPALFIDCFFAPRFDQHVRVYRRHIFAVQIAADAARPLDDVAAGLRALRARSLFDGKAADPRQYRRTRGKGRLMATMLLPFLVLIEAARLGGDLLRLADAHYLMWPAFGAAIFFEVRRRRRTTP